MTGIRIEDLNEETREKLDIRLPPPIGQVANNLIALGKVFRALKGLSNEDALHILAEAERYIVAQGVPDIQEGKAGSYVPPVAWTIQVVASTFNLTPALLKQRGREPEVALARQVCMYVLSMTNTYTLWEIGQALGGRTPATVSYGFQKVAQQLTEDISLKKKVSGIMTRLTGEEH